ncbi:hypothetical protein BFG52_16525 [Acinetobacter larvae]|uniref:Uncharacterized protein n=1 Tax=Acinetobacter larvae TaxID=1789224 RepID=A0A1B2M3M9_9GAMM|nr:hypothetical protein BFG52_16525 [Acinetobacter larvae]
MFELKDWIVDKFMLYFIHSFCLELSIMALNLKIWCEGLFFYTNSPELVMTDVDNLGRMASPLGGWL